VAATDPGPDAEAKLRASLENARPAAEKLYGSANVKPGTLTFANSVEEAVADADFIQESAPEREDLKRKLHARIDAAARPDTIIASSSSGLMPTAIQSDCKHPDRVLIGHPFNPVYLLPLCEVVGGDKTSADNIQRAMEFYRSIGMYALHVRKEIEGYLSDRLQEAIWREILHLVNDGVATTGELDDAIKYGPGLRWAFMGTNLIFHMAGGDTGMRHMLHQFGPALKLPWTKLEAPELTDELIDRMVEGTHEQAEGKTVKELEQLRDNCLIDIMRTLQKYEIASGKVLAEDEARREAGG
jgi:carnitine 3-dehydrogenase